MLYLLTIFIFLTVTIHGSTQVSTFIADEHIQLTINNKQAHGFYKDIFTFSTDTPYLTLLPWSIDKESFKRFDPETNETRDVIKQPFTITIPFKKNQGFIETHPMALFITFQEVGHSIEQQQHVLRFKQQKAETQQEHSITNPIAPQITANTMFSMQQLQQSLSHLMQQTNSLWFRLILVFLLGILLSFTPCIYPMIPITAGVLHAQKSNSLLYNFLLSCSYTFGLSTTFALLGILASSTGPLYGKLLVHPVSVLFIVILLGYMAFSMFGFYDIYIPSMLRKQHNKEASGSLSSSFLLGLMSGSIASPCISPGLILILSIVATIGNLFIGFLLLFMFGIGLSMPLLFIGTFSSSLGLLPQAGQWMLEIKKFFGIILLAVCFYYLSNILPLWIVFSLSALFIAALGVYYIWSGLNVGNISIKKFNNSIGSIFLIAAIIIFIQTMQYHYYTEPNIVENSNWLTDYEHARAIAQQQRKYMLLDFWAEYCSICKYINNYILTDARIQHALSHYVLVKIDGTNNSEPFNYLKNKFHVIGFPTILIVDPTTEHIIKQWHSEIYHQPREQIAKELSVLSNA